MNFSISVISLRTRLLLMTALAFLALSIAVLSAYRTARMSAYYAERQASASVNAVLTRLADEESNPGNYENKRIMPPHIKEAFEKYKDSFTRSVAIAMQAEKEVSAGYCNSNNEIVGAVFSQNFNSDEKQIIENICYKIEETDIRSYEFNDSVLFIRTAFVDKTKDGITGTFAARSVGKSGIFADRFNFLTQGFLLLSAVGLLIFSFLTMREWRGGMLKIEHGLQEIPNDLSARIDEPKIAELAFLSREINRLAENLETNLARQSELEKNLANSEKLAALGRVASGVAHEIRNPLAAMKLKIQMAARSDFDKSKLEKTFAVLNEEIARLDRLISKMLDAGNRKKLDFELIAPEEILRERLEFVREKSEAQNVRIESDFSAKGEKVNADAEKLTQIFDNLLLNALEAMPNGGTLKVNSLRHENKIMYEFSDSGAGVSATEKEKIFEPFFTTKDKGTGLGLAISREIVEAHGGKLFLADTENGAKFVVELPRDF